MFSQRHYIAIARVLGAERPNKKGVRLDVWRSTVAALVRMFSQDNQKFNSAMFLAACGYKENDHE